MKKINFKDLEKELNSRGFSVKNREEIPLWAIFLLLEEHFSNSDKNL
jgi:hypothetical protein